MKVLGCVALGGGAGGDFVFRVFVDRAWEARRIASLVRLGRLAWFCNLPRPFFQLVTAEGCALEGIEGEHECRVVGAAYDEATLRERLVRQFEAID